MQCVVLSCAYQWWVVMGYLIQVWRLGDHFENCYCVDVRGCPCIGEMLTEVFNFEK